MSPRVDSPTNLARSMDDEEDVLDTSSLTSRPLRRVPTPMGQSRNSGSPRTGDECLFDKAEEMEKGSVRSQGSNGKQRSFFGADFETLHDLKSKAQGAAKNGKITLRELVDSMTTPRNAPEKSKTPNNDDERSNTINALKLFDAISKPFAACTTNLPHEVEDAVGDLVAGTATAVMRRDPSDDFSGNYSYDEEFDEDQQIRRLSSWNTLETAATYQTNASYLSQGTDTPVAAPVFDDDGNRIPSFLVDVTKEMRQQRTRRKRVVKFEYPPISSLKECPRPDPNDLPNLYFTEDELNQIEDDRMNTAIADDVEVVCVSSSESSESQQPPPYESRPLREMGGVDESDTTSLLHQHENAKQTSQPKQRRFRARSPAPRTKGGLFGKLSKDGRQPPPAVSGFPPKHPASPEGSPLSNLPPTMDSGGTDEEVSGCPNDATAACAHGGNKKRLIKSVHIFMRERSRERSAEI
mmetsp:Transcript_1878/g.3599  ORF Transcript_1878/g.3599 Transcript_1878/m.3599 type:complete len:466 (-) Transcript_1878:162-1559(-)|eukprot:scaffold6899_cov183-Amphora_coffeaeformis.AAC.16